jgi:hypothetical protein
MIYAPYFTLPTNSSLTIQPHLILSYTYECLYFDKKVEPQECLYIGTERLKQNKNGHRSNAPLFLVYKRESVEISKTLDRFSLISILTSRL